MKHTYKIEGMTCGSCVARVKSELLKLPDVISAEVQLAYPQAEVNLQKHIALPDLQKAIARAGHYTITEEGTGHQVVQEAATGSWWQTYKPVLLIGLYITGVTLLAEVSSEGGFDIHRGMSHFMAGFFLTFSFFKMLDLGKFAASYSTYDVVAGIWKPWGFIYPFIELGLGLAFLLRWDLMVTNGITFVVMGISIIGVLKSVISKRKIQCACLGSVFNLPMSTITIIEDALMIIMSGAMLVSAVM